MGIFDRFPYSSTHEMNLDFMLGKATEIAEDMQTVTAGMAQVQAGLSAISEKTEQATEAAAQAAASASSIEGSVTAAEEAAEEAQMHNESAQTWANNAMTYKADCQRSATEAAASSASAAQAATAAAASENTVATYAQAANASAQSAANNNDSAHQYANQASASASNATFHSSNAQTAATNAQTAATNANTSATNASASADRAASLKTDVETLHRMCVTAVDQAATQATNAANSAAQAAATKTDVENLVESLPEDFTDLNNTVNQLSDEIDGIDSDVTDLKSAINKLPKYEFPGFDVKTEEYTPQWPEGGKIEFGSNIGYIAKIDGQVKNAGTGTWIYSDFIPMSRLDGTVGNFTLHTSAACVSYYSEADFNSWLGHLSITSEYDPTYSKNDVLNNAPTGSAFIVICTDGARNELYAYLTAETAYTETVITNLPVFGRKIMHISFDDTNNAFADLTTNANTYTSLFDSPFFAVLKEMHDTYGAVFSCYCFYSVYTDDTRETLVFTLANCTTKFKDEFEANSDWLRFGFHSIDNYKEYTNVSESDATADWNTFINGIIPIVGLKCIDTLVRIQSFTGGQNACRGFRNGLCGARGFLSSDYSETGDNENIDSSNGYYLSAAQSKICGRMGKYYEPTEALYFFPSNWRIDWQTDLPGYLALFNTADRFNRSRYMIMYGHENTMTRSEGDIAAYRTKLITVCQWANNNGYVFAFPADLISY